MFKMETSLYANMDLRYGLCECVWMCAWGVRESVRAPFWGKWVCTHDLSCP